VAFVCYVIGFGQTDTTERVPVYRGCHSNLSNEELKKCSNDKIKHFLKVSFDYQMANIVFLTEESTQFQSDFVLKK
ncbi:hypothetical protein, partial [Winogradskyella poriferorum]|uniref:hypothetical protein n=1 Tax=Winogradskyella poriferorum TaxID=307627 RepID=UPI003D64BB13